MNHTTLAVVAVLAAALFSGASLAIPLQDVWAGGGHYDHHKSHHGSVTKIRNNENQTNACSGDLVSCINALTNIDCVHSTCIIGDITPFLMVTPH